MPDAVFVEDMAVVLDEGAVICRPGAASRRGETPGVLEALARHGRPLQQIQAPGTLDGGDVLVIGRQVFVGASARTNRAGIDQLARHKPLLLCRFRLTIDGVRHALMPIYEYRCRACNHRFELIVNGSTLPACPACKARDLEKQLSVFAVATSPSASPAPLGPCGRCGHPDGPGSCSVN
jgi:putative FmdB family regulatory protein